MRARPVSPNQRKLNMQIRKIVTLAILAVALAVPGVSLAKKQDKHGIGKGGLPALRDYLLKQIHELQNSDEDIEARLDAIEAQFKDDDAGFYVFQPDCDDADDPVGVCP
jgi:hypothetical protein